MNLNALAKKAAKGAAPAAYGGAMEVEDMIRFVLLHGPAAADEIERLRNQHQWVMEGLLPDGTRVVPFGRWAFVCIAFGRGGVGALRALLQDSSMASFVVGLLQEVKTVESVQALVDFCAAARFAATRHDEMGWVEWEALLALNHLLAFQDFVPIDAQTADKLRQILFSAHERASMPQLKGNVLLAMRGVPSDGALSWVQGLSDVDPALKEYQTACVKAIKSRLAPGFKPAGREQQRQYRRQRALDV